MRKQPNESKASFYLRFWEWLGIELEAFNRGNDDSEQHDVSGSRVE